MALKISDTDPHISVGDDDVMPAAKDGAPGHHTPAALRDYVMASAAMMRVIANHADGEPGEPVEGQLWYDAEARRTRQRRGAAWLTAGSFDPFPDAATLRAVPAAESVGADALAVLLGIDEIGDTIPLYLRWDDESTDDDDGVDVFRPTEGAAASGAGRWLRVPAPDPAPTLPVYYALTWGIVPGGASNGANFNALMDVVRAAGGGRVVFFDGTYAFETTPIIDGDNVSVVGHGESTVIELPAGGSLQLGTLTRKAHNIALADFKLCHPSGDDSAAYAVDIAWARNVSLRDVAGVQLRGGIRWGSKDADSGSNTAASASYLLFMRGCMWDMATTDAAALAGALTIVNSAGGLSAVNSGITCAVSTPLTDIHGMHFAPDPHVARFDGYFFENFGVAGFHHNWLVETRLVNGVDIAGRWDYAKERNIYFKFTAGDLDSTGGGAQNIGFYGTVLGQNNNQGSGGLWLDASGAGITDLVAEGIAVFSRHEAIKIIGGASGGVWGSIRGLRFNHRPLAASTDTIAISGGMHNLRIDDVQPIGVVETAGGLYPSAALPRDTIRIADDFKGVLEIDGVRSYGLSGYCVTAGASIALADADITVRNLKNMTNKANRYSDDAGVMQVEAAPGMRRGAIEQSFQLVLTVTGGVIQHRILSIGADGAAFPEKVRCIAGASATFTNTPWDTDASTAFAAGAKLGSAAPSLFYFDTPAQAVSAVEGDVSICYNNTGTAGLRVQALTENININGVTRRRLAFSFTVDGTGALFPLHSAGAATFANGKSIILQVNLRLTPA